MIQIEKRYSLTDDVDKFGRWARIFYDISNVPNGFPKKIAWVRYIMVNNVRKYELFLYFETDIILEKYYDTFLECENIVKQNYSSDKNLVN